MLQLVLRTLRGGRRAPTIAPLTPRKRMRFPASMHLKRGATNRTTQGRVMGKPLDKAVCMNGVLTKALTNAGLSKVLQTHGASKASHWVLRDEGVQRREGNVEAGDGGRGGRGIMGVGMPGAGAAHGGEVALAVAVHAAREAQGEDQDGGDGVDGGEGAAGQGQVVGAQHRMRQGARARRGDGRAGIPRQREGGGRRGRCGRNDGGRVGEGGLVMEGTDWRRRRGRGGGDARERGRARCLDGWGKVQWHGQGRVVVGCAG